MTNGRKVVNQYRSGVLKFGSFSQLSHLNIMASSLRRFFSQSVSTAFVLKTSLSPFVAFETGRHYVVITPFCLYPDTEDIYKHFMKIVVQSILRTIQG